MSQIISCRLNHYLSVVALDGKIIIAGVASIHHNPFVEVFELADDIAPIIGLTNIRENIVHIHTTLAIHELDAEGGIVIRRIGSMP